MNKRKDFFATTIGIIVVGLVLGGLAVTLQKLGNPANMGVCMACFTRDVAGALGLHRAAPVQYLRPEIPAFCLGAFLAALLFREFRPRTGSAPITRFLLGMFAAIGALIFLGCPWRALLRLAGGDWNAVVGLAGLVAGIAVGVQFVKWGFSLGRSHPTGTLAGLTMPFVMLVLVVLAVFYPHVGENAALFRSEKGPGAATAPVAASIGVALLIGFLAQRTRFCTVGGFRDALLMRDFHLLSGVLAFLVAAFALNFVYGQFHAGFTLGTGADGKPIMQPAAHTVHWLNFAGMVLAGLSFTLAGGCPGRQVFLSGEGDGDAAVFVLGMLTGAAVAHNFLMVGTGLLAPYTVVGGLVIVVGIGILGREKLALAR
jgi:YedE family putative selenium metabolism protein